MAALTWTNTDTLGLNLTAKGVGASGTATDAPTGTEGIALANAQAWDLALEADSGQTLSGAGTLECWIYLLGPAGWCRAKEFDVSVSSAWASGARRVTFLGTSAGKGTPVIARAGRVCFVPNGVTVSSGGVTVYLDGLVGART